jgi:hypothetical protein
MSMVKLIVGQTHPSSSLIFDLAEAVSPDEPCEKLSLNGVSCATQSTSKQAQAPQRLSGAGSPQIRRDVLRRTDLPPEVGPRHASRSWAEKPSEQATAALWRLWSNELHTLVHVTKPLQKSHARQKTARLYFFASQPKTFCIQNSRKLRSTVL